MIAEKAKVKKGGLKDLLSDQKCAKCGSDEKPLPHKSPSNGGKVCDECFLKASQGELPMDEYTLMPNERTVEQAADYLKCTKRNVQLLLAAGTIAATKKRRRDASGTVRKQNIFDLADLDAYKNTEDEETARGVVVKEGGEGMNEEKGIQLRSDPEQFMQMLSAMVEQIAPPRVSPLAQVSGKLRLSIEEAAAAGGVAKTRLAKAVHAAETEKRIQRFSGDHGRAVYNCDDLEMIIDAVPPVDIVQRTPPKRKKE